jgi:hypothetical protein
MLAEDTTDLMRRYGGPDQMNMEELDEFGSAEAQKISAGDTCGFPMKFYGIGLQWSRLWFMNHMASELAAQVTSMQDADIRAIHRELKKALFIKDNYSFVDVRMSRVTLAIKALINADSSQMPLAPDGTSFDGATHTHYLGATAAAWGTSTAANKQTDFDTITNTVLEHFLSGSIEIYINRAQETQAKTATNFTPYVDGRLIMAPGGTANIARGNLDMTNVTNRAIGINGAAEVWVKPWIPAGYILAVHKGDGTPALVRRIRAQGSGNLDLLAEDEAYPLRAKQFGREYGFGVYNRVGAACLYTGATSYTNPTIT